LARVLGQSVAVRIHHTDRDRGAGIPKWIPRVDGTCRIEILDSKVKRNFLIDLVGGFIECHVCGNAVFSRSPGPDNCGRIGDLQREDLRVAKRRVGTPHRFDLLEHLKLVLA